MNLSKRKLLVVTLLTSLAAACPPAEENNETTNNETTNNTTTNNTTNTNNTNTTNTNNTNTTNTNNTNTTNTTNTSTTQMQNLTFTGALPDLEAGFVYEGWLKEDGEAPVSTGQFSATELDTNDAIEMEVPSDLASSATQFILTIEPDDNDPAPSAAKYLAGDIANGAADLDTSIIGDFSNASGTYFLATPTTENDQSDFNMGIWFMDNSAAMPTAGLTDLPDLSGSGWIYEGWVVDPGGEGPVSTGRFTDPTMADADMGGDGAGSDDAPPFPGSDFITEGYDLTADWRAVVSVEPWLGDTDANGVAPFAPKPLAGDIPTDATRGQLQTMTNQADSLPEASIIIE
jgi:hypothetical protein